MTMHELEAAAAGGGCACASDVRFAVWRIVGGFRW